MASRNTSHTRSLGVAKRTSLYLTGHHGVSEQARESEARCLRRGGRTRGVRGCRCRSSTCPHATCVRARARRARKSQKGCPGSRECPKSGVRGGVSEHGGVRGAVSEGRARGRIFGVRARASREKSEKRSARRAKVVGARLSRARRRRSARARRGLSLGPGRGVRGDARAPRGARRRAGSPFPKVSSGVEWSTGRVNVVEASK